LRHSAGEKAGDAARVAGRAAGHTFGFTHHAIGTGLRALAAQLQKMPARTAFAAGAVRDFAAPRLRALPGVIAGHLKSGSAEPALLMDTHAREEIFSDATRAAAAESLHIGLRRPSPELLRAARIPAMTTYATGPDPDVTVHFTFPAHTGTTSSVVLPPLTNTVLAQHFGSALHFERPLSAAPSSPTNSLVAEHLQRLENITEETEADLAGSREHLPAADTSHIDASHLYALDSSAAAAPPHPTPEAVTPTASVHSNQPDPEEWEFVTTSAPTTPKAA
jgi:hypothetical protein